MSIGQQSIRSTSCVGLFIAGHLNEK